MGEDAESRRWALVEQMAGDMQTIKEQVGLIPEMRADIAELKGDVAELKGDIAVVKSTLLEHSTDLREIKQVLGQTIETVAELKEASHTH